MFGVLLDVSGSMRQAYALDTSHDASVQRTHAVFSTVANIVKREANRHNRQESIFATVFGLEGPTTTCDLIPLLEILRESRRAKDAFCPLVELAKQHNAPHMEKWIREYLTEMEAALLCHSLRSDASLIPEFLKMIPSSGFKEKVAFQLSTEERAHNSEAYSLARKIIFGSFVPNPQPKPVQYVSELFDELLHSKESTKESSRVVQQPSSALSMVWNSLFGTSKFTSSHATDCSASNDGQSLQNQIEKIVEAIAPYIYGGTPMCKAMNDALSVFRRARRDDAKVLFILSDGEPA